MSTYATLNVAASFLQSSSVTAVEAQKKVTLTSSLVFSPFQFALGKVIFITGTCNVSGVTIDPAASGYIGADGQEVSITNVKFVAFAANPHANLEADGLNGLKMSSRDNGAAVSFVPQAVGVGDSAITIKTVGGFNDPSPTAAYSLVVYGET
jgi:hypothetical protein